MEDCFDVVGVGVEEVGAVVAGVVVGPFAGCAVVSAAGGEAEAVEVADRFLVVDADREVEVLGGWPGEDGEGAGLGDQLQPLAQVAGLESDGRRDAGVEALAVHQVCNADPEVVDRAALGADFFVVDGLDAVVVVVAEEAAVVPIRTPAVVQGRRRLGSRPRSGRASSRRPALASWRRRRVEATGGWLLLVGWNGREVAPFMKPVAVDAAPSELEQREQLVEELPGLVEVADAQGDVVDARHYPGTLLEAAA
jgi:hypothetical protein